MADSARVRRIAERTKQLITQGLSTVVKDPGLGFVTITDTRMTGDLQHATVFYTVLGTDEERQHAAAVLERYRGRLRSYVGKGLGIRLTPSLEFVPDALPEEASQLTEALRQAAERDAALAAARAESQYAGEADPYRKPREHAEPAESHAEAAEHGDDAPATHDES